MLEELCVVVLGLTLLIVVALLIELPSHQIIAAYQKNETAAMLGLGLFVFLKRLLIHSATIAISSKR